MTEAERAELVDRYVNGPQLLRQAVAKVPAEALKWKPAPDKWSVHEVVCHCADSETVSAARIRFLVGEDSPTIVGYNQDRWARTFAYHDLPLEASLKQVESVRAWTSELLRRLPNAAWSRAGTHTESGHYTAEAWLSIYAEHLEIHARQVERNLAAWRAARGGAQS
jgi:hypothetical protein